MTISLHNRQDAMTPILTVIEPRGLAARTVAYYRSNLEEPVSERVTRQQFDAAGRPIACTDPRLGAPNQSAVFSLSNRVLLTDSVDAGWRLLLADANANNAESWDSRGSHWRTEFDELARPVAISEQGPGQPEQVITRLGYGAVSAPAAAHNQCGRLVRNDDSAGTQLFADYTLSGTALSATRHFLTRLQTPDWPQPVTERDALLEPGSGATTNWQYSALGETTCQIDASGHQQRTSYNVAGEVNGATLQLKGGTQTAVFHSVAYNAFGQIESQTLGNGVTRTSQYDPASGRLIKLTSTRPGSTLQSLSYQHDPVGNVLQIEDFAQSVHFFAHHKTSPINTYRYDSLYQLIEATGSEALGASIGPHLPELAPNPGDLSLLVNYRQTYQYDAGGNLTELRHTGQQNYTRTMLIAPKSNRGLTQLEIPDFNAAFDANGNQQALQPGQPLSWDNRNQLSRTVQVSRQGGSDDEERYIYDASGQRLRKVGTRQAKMVTHTSEVRYLPGLEIHTHEGERLEVVIATAVRCLHWAHGKPDAVENDQLRYTLDDHLGSSTLELDAHASLISHEGYYPYGGTAWWSARSAVEAAYKTIRYSGKERDASGLYYYGMRYYAPWLQRWINPDPAGTVDGLNLYRMLRNNPLNFVDPNGNAPQEVEAAYNHMLKHGEAWEDIRTQGNGFTAISELSDRNMARLKQDLDLSAAEELFVTGFQEEVFNLVHFSNKDFRDSSGALTLQSRKQLQKNKITFDKNNTELLDIESFATNDFVFFSLEAGEKNQKEKSRFGEHRYRTVLEPMHEYHDVAHLELTDLAQIDQRPVTNPPAWVAHGDKDLFFRSAESNTILPSIFMGMDMIEGLALSIVNELQPFSGDTKEAVFELQRSGQSDVVMNSLFRPQILIPHSLTISKSNLSYKGPAKSTASAASSAPIVKHFYV